MKQEKIYIGSDHAGFEMKEKLKKYLEEKNIPCQDLGAYSQEPVDYPDYALQVAKKVAENKNIKGILICGSGTGMVIAANKIKGIRAAMSYDEYSAKMSRQDNDANILCLRARFCSFTKIKKIVSVWLNTSFSREARHQRRINKIKEMEK